MICTRYGQYPSPAPPHVPCPRFRSMLTRPPGRGGRRRIDAGIQPAVPADQGLILQSLQQGEWKPGEAIPSEMELAARFRVSQGTVRKAIDELAAENLVVRRQGKGTFVATHAEQHVQYRFLKLMPDTGDQCGRPGPAQHLDCRACAPAPTWPALWPCAAGDPVMQAGASVVCRRPTILEDIWLPGQAFKGLTPSRWPTTRAHLCHVRAGFRCAHGARRRKNPRRAADGEQSRPSCCRSPPARPC
jgi:GntR family transcriptional regulator